ncbi:cupin domain-containing protein [Vulgatibacter sp.]|uniref:cupin domain-containing protein n=1 Tax=Vulgatibacter sp. TaxID=1971226 RepID=UPI0035696792
MIRSAEVEEYGVGGHAVAGLVAPSRGGSELTLQQARLAPGAATPEHRHDREELVVLASGVLEVACGEKTQRVLPGDVAILPAGTCHQLVNVAHEEAVMLLVGGAGARSFCRDGRELPTPPWLR